MTKAKKSIPMPKCPIRPGEPCTLCFPGADGPHNCGLVYLVQDDPEMAAEMASHRRSHRERQREKERVARG